MPTIPLRAAAPLPPLRLYTELTLADFSAEWPGLTSSYLEGFLGRDSVVELYRIEHGLMDYGLHWRWAHGQQFYTPAGLLLIIDELRQHGQPGAALALATHARQCDALFRARRQCNEDRAAAMAARRTGEAA